MTKRQLPPLNALRAFEAAARRGSFTAAAEELSVSQGAVSRHIQHLEAVLGIELFTRGHRLVSLTRAGRDYAEAVSGALGTIEAATLRAKDVSRSAPVRFRALPNFVFQWLMPRLGRFTSEHPAIEVLVSAGDEGPLLDSEGIDLTIHVHQPRQPGLVYDKLFDLALIPVCAPALAARLEPVRHPRDLARVALIYSAKRPEDWGAWFAAAGEAGFPAPPGIVFENSALVHRGALSGLGIALLHRDHVSVDIDEGRLICPWPIALKLDKSFYLVSRKGTTSRNVSLFRKWLINTARSGVNTKGMQSSVDCAA